MAERKNMRDSASSMAFGGVFAALALVIMCLGSLIPLATFVCPMLACMLAKLVAQTCGNRIGWTWYGAVAILSVLLAPDKEAAAVFVFLGYYPMLKPKLDRLPFKWLWKLLYFNVAIISMYMLLIHVIGIAQVVEEWETAGFLITLVTLLLGNITFVMLDILLGRRWKKR